MVVCANRVCLKNIKALFLRRWLLDDSGQDLIQYGLLASIIATAGYLVLPDNSSQLPDLNL